MVPPKKICGKGKKPSVSATPTKGNITWYFPKKYKTLENFNKLPTELRFRIWELTYPGARKIKCRQAFWRKSEDNPFSHLPPILALHICHESRELALRTYKSFFTDAITAPTPGETHNFIRNPHFDVKNDILDFAVFHPGIYHSLAYNFPESNAKSLIPSVKFLRFTVDDWICNIDLLDSETAKQITSAFLKSYQSLEAIILVIPYFYEFDVGDVYSEPDPEHSISHLITFPDWTYGSLKEKVVNAFREADPRWDGRVDGGKDLVVRYEHEKVATPCDLPMHHPRGIDRNLSVPPSRY